MARPGIRRRGPCRWTASRSTPLPRASPALWRSDPGTITRSRSSRPTVSAGRSGACPTARLGTFSRLPPVRRASWQSAIRPAVSSAGRPGGRPTAGHGVRSPRSRARSTRTGTRSAQARRGSSRSEWRAEARHLDLGRRSTVAPAGVTERATGRWAGPDPVRERAVPCSVRIRGLDESGRLHLGPPAGPRRRQRRVRCRGGARRWRGGGRTVVGGRPARRGRHVRSLDERLDPAARGSRLHPRARAGNPGLAGRHVGSSPSATARRARASSLQIRRSSSSRRGCAGAPAFSVGAAEAPDP